MTWWQWFLAVVGALIAGHGVAYAAQAGTSTPEGVVSVAVGMATITGAVVKILDTRLKGRMAQFEAHIDGRFNELERRLGGQR